MNTRSRPHGTVLFVGPILGGHPGRIASPAEAVAERLEQEGLSTTLTSRKLNPVARGLEMLRDVSLSDGERDVAVVLVYSGRSFHYADAVSRACRGKGLPVIFWLHGGGLPELAATATKRLRRVMERGSAHIVPSGFLRREMAAVLPTEARIIPNLLDIESYPFRPRAGLAPRLLWMRSFVPHCRPDLAVRTLATLAENRPDATLTMAGPDQGELEATRGLADELGLTDRVRFVGFVSGEAKRRELDRHDIYLHTNAVDNAPISLLEAGACGLPIVGCDVGGVADLMPPERASLLSTDSDPDALAGSVERLLGDPEVAATLAAEARRIAEASSWPRLREAWLSVLGEEPAA